ncbi:MAG: cytochrome b N-terminal domain-containing protein [Planctomycetaceae bacterium]|nr:cytochrome b N-terminal domain-containing protein [Planctomycetaceae bacterium]
MIQWLNDRTGAVTGLKTFWYWTVPATKCIFSMIPAMIIFAFLLQGITGVIMWSHYSPSAQTAWESVFFFQYHIPFGWLIRGIHHYSAQSIVGLLGFYLFVSILRYSYRSPREFVFWGALVLFILSLCSCLTGDLLSWTLPGYSATLVRVRFLQMIPYVGGTLFKLVLGNPGPEFGTYTLTRFLVLHIMVFGGGFFAFLALWRFFDFRAKKIEIAKNVAGEAFAKKMNAESDGDDKPERPKLAYFWSGQLFFTSIACMVFMAATLGLVFQHELCDKFHEKFQKKDKAEVAVNADAPDAKDAAVDKVDVPKVDWSGLPKEARRGAVLMSPASPGTAYNAARPEWSFRAVYHYSNMFPADKKFIAIFVVLPAVGLFFFLVPILGKFKPLHYLIVLITLAFAGAVGYMTWASYRHDFTDPDYLIAVAEAEDLAVRATELALRPDGIPLAGALSLMQSDPKVKGRELYIRHCATCHAFVPQPGEAIHADFMPYYPPKPAEGAEPWKATAPNLYNPISKHWIAGFVDKVRITSDDYLGGTSFARGSMVQYVRDTLPDTMEFIDEMIADDDPDDPMYSFASAEEGLDLLNDMLYREALRDGRRAVVDKLPAGISEKRYELFTEFGCDETGCHKFYDKGAIGSAADLTGYMSREWLIGSIANIEDPRYYGAKNDGMPVYYVEGSADSTMTLQEVELIADFLRGNWYRPERPVAALENVEETKPEPVVEPTLVGKGTFTETVIISETREPGYNFVNQGTPLGNNPPSDSASSKNVGTVGLRNFNLGRQLPVDAEAAEIPSAVVASDVEPTVGPVATDTIEMTLPSLEPSAVQPAGEADELSDLLRVMN